MSISTGTLNLKFMQRGTPLKASPSGPSTPTPSTPGTPVPASKGTSTSRTLVAEQDSEWQLPASKLKALQAGAGPSRPTQTRGRVSYESSYLPFLERGQPATTSSRKQLDSEEDGSVDDDEDKGVGSSKVIKGRMIFGQSAKPEKTNDSDDEEPSSRSNRPNAYAQEAQSQSHTRSGPSSRPGKPPPSTPNGKKPSKNGAANVDVKPSSMSKPDKRGYIRPAGFDDLPTPASRTEEQGQGQATKSNRRQKRKSNQAPVADDDVKTKSQTQAKPEADDDDDEVIQGARKRRKKSKSKKDKVAVKQAGANGNGDDEDPEFEEFLEDLMGEIEDDR
ncbi:hypothetical protein HD553DRAFT_353084 [Filobasidium floriforme]|uniref:uncharacterized protein n=1 Tax=Filobasidium floriforme TaxID=5210 RepID=UPI001E8E68E4|nr:uncharacterized protein HD553DRAFT_353084 [Filobasidium floriforme]KAH8078292.1 hypothetical protein HD553DRAFT_353084 [Filobasidium floriforme]